jgi:hypothetical protein
MHWICGCAWTRRGPSTSRCSGASSANWLQEALTQDCVYWPHVLLRYLQRYGNVMTDFSLSIFTACGADSDACVLRFRQRNRWLPSNGTTCHTQYMYCENHKKHTNILHELNAEVLNVRASVTCGYYTTTVLSTASHPPPPQLAWVGISYPHHSNDLQELKQLIDCVGISAAWTVQQTTYRKRGL